MIGDNDDDARDNPGHDPGKHIISATYAQDFSFKLHNDHRTILASRSYKDLLSWNPA